ncbi:hypothetical protein, partial [Pseudomonas putida]|uniref:hypothetical protein n=1 Tax=Pseudomonas putida TaxID=303 RepID=UPI001E363CF2
MPGAALRPFPNGPAYADQWTAPKKLDTNPTLGGFMAKYTEQFKLTAITAYLDGSNGFRTV